MEQVSAEGAREIRRTNWWLSNRGLPAGNPDALFDDEGAVKLPKLVGMAIGLAREHHGCLTRQPTMERAEAVRDALLGRIRDGETMEIRPGRTTDTFGVYLVG